ncbi:MAG: anthrone oxygenase family protein [Thiotrichales bacterium]
MNLATTTAIILALLGSALIGGIFFAFSSFIMKALARLPSSEGTAAMQSINVVVLNPSFLGAFMGTAAIALVLAVIAVTSWETAASPWLLAGSLLYLVGTFLVTGRGNVPLNDQLAAVQAKDPAATKVWEHYLSRWTLLNTVRTLAAIAAALMFAMALIQTGG